MLRCQLLLGYPLQHHQECEAVSAKVDAMEADIDKLTHLYAWADAELRGLRARLGVKMEEA